MTITFTAEVFEPNLKIKEEFQSRYSKICKWAWKRYTKSNTLLISIGGKPSLYSLIEQMAWDKYMLDEKN